MGDGREEDSVRAVLEGSMVVVRDYWGGGVADQEKAMPLGSCVWWRVHKEGEYRGRGGSSSVRALSRREREGEVGVGIDMRRDCGGWWGGVGAGARSDVERDQWDRLASR